jgi:hypothetical protein
LFADDWFYAIAGYDCGCHLLEPSVKLSDISPVERLLVMDVKLFPKVVVDGGISLMIHQGISHDGNMLDRVW